MDNRKNKLVPRIKRYIHYGIIILGVIILLYANIIMGYYTASGGYKNKEQYFFSVVFPDLITIEMFVWALIPAIIVTIICRNYEKRLTILEEITREDIEQLRNETPDLPQD